MKNLDNNWIRWFTGFCDAEGNFQVYPKKRVLKSGVVSKYNVGLGFHLSLHSRDSELLHDIHEKLNHVGVFYEFKNRNEARIAVNDRTGLRVIVDVFSLFPLVTIHQYTRYCLLKEYLVNDIKEFKTLDEFNIFKDKCLDNIDLSSKVLSGLESQINSGLLDSWIVGLINGEGCFYLNKGRCNFFIEHTDLQALEIIKKRLAFSPKIVARSPRARDVGKNIKPTYMLIVSSKKDIESLIELLDCERVVPLAGHKLMQYTEWKQTWFNK
uniref:LAGLIDADG endonuclease n=1 Tax=Chrysoporthe austroafricana TaxID=354353 RepID=A0A191MX34_9PEZI|nr:LAGLIDADG endonuclease [Chrysoporthe austroafricana]AMX22113.1 LAGLIDADG endonuclease [Chrysoporthe austroafricana]